MLNVFLYYLLRIAEILAIKRVIEERVPLVILGVDGYSYESYIKYGNKSSGHANMFPIQPIFPSKTFPDFMSIATGLHPTQHGVINNKFYNQNRDLKFRYEDEQNEEFDWYKGEPIWITAKKAGLRSYIDTWVGSIAQYGGLKPDIVFEYRANTFEQKVEGLIENIDAEYGTRCDLYMIYSDEPDYSLHKHDNTDNDTVQEIIDVAERRINLLKSSLGDRKYNLIILSDHGMSGYRRKYHLPKYIRDKAKFFYEGAIPVWYSKHEQNKSVAEEVIELNQFLQWNGMTGISAVEVATLDNRFQLCGMEEEGLPDILFMGEDDVAIEFGEDFAGHGYDNTFPKMYGHVRVSGPGFKEIPGVEDRPIRMNTELYNFFCSLLGIQPANNAGGLDTFDFLLSSPPNRAEWKGSYSQLQAPCDQRTPPLSPTKLRDRRQQIKN